MLLRLEAPNNLGEMVERPSSMSEEDSASTYKKDNDLNQKNIMYDSSISDTLIDPRTIQPWTAYKPANDFFVSLLTALYALILTIVSLVVEVSPTWTTQIKAVETIFFLFMYGGGILFLAYCYIFMIYPQGFNFFVKLLDKARLINRERWMILHTNHTGDGAGTLYLRLGALFFGSVGIVLFGLEIFLCVRNTGCKADSLIKLVVAMLFTFIQMHFIFCNSKISIVWSKKLAKLGMMHMVSINLWTWFRFVLAKQSAKANKKKAVYTKATDDSSSSSEEDLDFTMQHGYLSDVVNNTIEAVVNSAVKAITSTTMSTTTVKAKSRLLTLDYFGDIATFLTTCIVEYSLIGAAVMFILWSSIGDAPATPDGHVKRKHKMRIDCSSSSTGLFAGIIFLIAACVSMGMYTIFDDLRNNKGSQLVFDVVDLSMFCILLLACMLGLWRMRLLQYRLHAHGEVIDEILLIIGLVGELIYCIIEFDIYISTRHIDPYMTSCLPAFVVVFRLTQVVVQSAFILTTSRLRCLSPYALKYKPGKEIITFLLVSNVTLFVFHTFEAMKPNFGNTSFTSSTYTLIIYAVAPLLVFYRFHSSACLAEIWKHTYSIKHHKHGHHGHNHHHQDGIESAVTSVASTPRHEHAVPIH